MAWLVRLLAWLGRPRVPTIGSVAVVRLYGPIMAGRRLTELIELIRRLRESSLVPAVVLDVDSPGGSATASDDLHLALRRLAERKPLVAAIRGTGTSGAYLAAVAARTIVAQPHAVVGSIGVISVRPRVVQLLERLGVAVSETKSGPFKGMGAAWREETDEERAKEQSLVDEFFGAFVERVASARSMVADDVRSLATGEVWLAERARELGLVDEIGDLEHAVELAASAAGVPARSAVAQPRRRLLDRVVMGVGTTVAEEVEARLGGGLRM